MAMVYVGHVLMCMPGLLMAVFVGVSPRRGTHMGVFMVLVLMLVCMFVNKQLVEMFVFVLLVQQESRSHSHEQEGNPE